jgi:hypothetical protein
MVGTGRQPATTSWAPMGSNKKLGGEGEWEPGGDAADRRKRGLHE